MVETIHEEQQNASADVEVITKHKLALHVEALLRRFISEDIEGKIPLQEPRRSFTTKRVGVISRINAPCTPEIIYHVYLAIFNLN
eukprot:CAMPEP_0194368634 /NCGR_PEP_ID=MMETSP0174-20130528/16822_1 /TAXON_ID=216777 /ORGANISM="Proboscia alata, Strain PI-D3" /LENGTH=84 /DNA_ID=CAMNT_0039145061 /DNA_START=696 /DNA_END=950 /DNA_ORIENTATION=+